MDREAQSILEWKLHALAVLKLDRGLTPEEIETWEKLYQEYIDWRKMMDKLTPEEIQAIWDTDEGWISWVQFGQAVAKAQLAKSQECPECKGKKQIHKTLMGHTAPVLCPTCQDTGKRARPDRVKIASLAASFGYKYVDIVERMDISEDFTEATEAELEFADQIIALGEKSSKGVADGNFDKG